MTAATMTEWSPAQVVAAAKELIHSSNYEKVSQAREHVDHTLAAWVRAVQSLSTDSPERKQGEAHVVALWVAYAQLEMELRQFKQTTKVFESAVACPVAGSSADIWLRYAAFCTERKKFSNARKVFVRALSAVEPSDQDAIWTQFHSFVQEHIDPAMSMDSLKSQIGSVPLAPEKKAPQVDPGLAYVDTAGEEGKKQASPGKRTADNQESFATTKKARVEEQTRPLSNSKCFVHIPISLPVTPACLHLLFDAVADGETQKEIGNELLERLSDVLRDSAVFQGVKELEENQRKKDRETLYRWQELVATQMKEGSELFARHMDVERDAADPQDRMMKKTQHMEQRNEFVSRCQMSQQQFIEICEMDRLNALKAQQISLENMKIPEMCVSNDPSVVAMQRAIVALILEAEKLWREEQEKAKAEEEKARAQAASSRASSRRKEDSGSSSHGSRGSSRGSRSGRRSHPRSSSPFNARGGGSGLPPGASNVPVHAGYDHAPPGSRLPMSHHQGPLPTAAHGAYPPHPEYEPAAYATEYEPAPYNVPANATRYGTTGSGGGGPGWPSHGEYPPQQVSRAGGPPPSSYPSRRSSPKPKGGGRHPHGGPSSGPYGPGPSGGKYGGGPRRGAHPGGSRYGAGPAVLDPAMGHGPPPGGYDDMTSYDFVPDNAPYNNAYAPHNRAMQPNAAAAQYHMPPQASNMQPMSMAYGGGGNAPGGRPSYGQQVPASHYGHSSPPRGPRRGGGGGGHRYGRR